MSFSLRILPAADTDLDEAALYIARDSEEQALRLYDSADATFRLIREHPERWPVYELDHPRLQGLRRCSIVRFRNHLVFYRLEGNVVEVIRVLHGARDIMSILSDREEDK
jgi:toxin ParE1/3/4